eukprot:403335414
MSKRYKSGSSKIPKSTRSLSKKRQQAQTSVQQKKRGSKNHCSIDKPRNYNSKPRNPFQSKSQERNTSVNRSHSVTQIHQQNANQVDSEYEKKLLILRQQQSLNDHLDKNNHKLQKQIQQMEKQIQEIQHKNHQKLQRKDKLAIIKQKNKQMQKVFTEIQKDSDAHVQSLITQFIKGIDENQKQSSIMKQDIINKYEQMLKSKKNDIKQQKRTNMELEKKHETIKNMINQII